MADKKALGVVLEKVGNQPLKTTKILWGALGLGHAAAKSNGGTKSTPKSTVDKISAAPNDEFDAIFGSSEPKVKKQA